MNGKYWALIQIGYAVFGVGTSEEEARADARQWLDNPADAERQEPSNVDGNICCVPCSKPLYQQVKQYGTCTFTQNNGVALLEGDAP